MKDTPVRPKLQIAKNVHDEIRDFVGLQLRSIALNLVRDLFQEEVLRLCGRPFTHKHGLCHRGGNENGSVVLQGQRLRVKRPRIRRGQKEVHLESYDALQGFDILSDKVTKSMLKGVSTRNYEPLLDELDHGLGLKKSSVSKAFKMSSQQSLNEINGRDLGPYRFVSLMIDGIEFGGHMVICALGITDTGKKIIVGLREGHTENSEVCVDLLQSIIERGLQHGYAILFVIDGSKALKKAICKVFHKALVQRCVRHKERNIISYLPDQYHMEFYRRWKLLHGFTHFAEAEVEYAKLAKWLGNINHEALHSLEEAEMETLTVVKLKCPMLLRKTLLSTNPIESAFSAAREMTSRVKNWNSGKNQVSRWAATTLLEAEKQFRTIKGFKQIPLLVAEMENLRIALKNSVA